MSSTKTAELAEQSNIAIQIDEATEVAELIPIEPILTEDGFLVDPDTGEIVGFNGPKGPGEEKTEKDFVVEILTRHGRASARLASSELKLKPLQDELATMIARAVKEVEESAEFIFLKRQADTLAGMKKESEKRLKWIEETFGPNLKSFAQKQLDGVKAKTWKNEAGSLSLRAQSPKAVPLKDNAFDWAELLGAKVKRSVTDAEFGKALENLIADRKLYDRVQTDPFADGGSPDERKWEERRKELREAFDDEGFERYLEVVKIPDDAFEEAVKFTPRGDELTIKH